MNKELTAQAASHTLEGLARMNELYIKKKETTEQRISVIYKRILHNTAGLQR